MDGSKGNVMFVWLFLVSLFSFSLQDIRDNGEVPREPQHVNFDHRAKVVVRPDQAGTVHSRNLTSRLAEECSSYNVTLGEDVVYPKDLVVEVGRNVTFCCFLAPHVTFDKIVFNRTKMNATNIDTGRYATVVHLHTHTPPSGTDVVCNKRFGSTIFAGYPPGDTALVCETRDLESVTCHWNKGRDTHLISNSSTTRYRLEGRRCPDKICTKKVPCQCSQKMPVEVGEKNWTVKAKNPLGEVELTDSADLRKRVYMRAPMKVTASSVNARNASLVWQWTAQKYIKLHLVCEVRLSYNGQTDIRIDSGFGLHSTVLRGLMPKQKYTVEIRCGTKQDFWKWGDWSEPINFDTRGDVPDALDVWMLVESKQVTLTWKTPLANQTHGQIKDYVVTWGSTTGSETQSRTVTPQKNSTALTLGPGEEFTVSVRARNLNGSSSPSVITVPWVNPGQMEKPSKIDGINGGFNLSWSISPAATCGYIVDWCPTFGKRSVEWIRVPAGKTTARIFSDNFKDGVRYNLSIYACTQGAPVLLEIRQGYVRETKLPIEQIQELSWKQSGSDVEISWPAIPEGEQSGFIQGYILYYTPSSANHNNNERVFNVSTDDPEASSLWARNLPIGSYTFTVKALTSAGEGGDRSLGVTMDNLIETLIIGVSTSLLSVIILLVLFTTLCYRNWECIKDKIYPQIPKPFLKDNLLSPMGARGPQILQVNDCPYSDVDIMDVPVMCFKEEMENDALSPKEETPFIAQTQSPKGYYNQPLKKNTATLLTCPANPVLPLLGSSDPKLNSMVENLTYNMGTGHSMVLFGDYQPNTESDSRPSPEIVTIMSYVSSEQNQFIDYQPQCRIEPGDNCPKSPSCSSTNSLITDSSYK